MKFHRFSILSLLAVLVLASAGWAGYRAKVRSNFTNESKLWFEGTSTLHDWKCEAKQVGGFVDHESSGKLKVSGAQVTIAVDDLDCGKAPMNTRMKLIMKSKENPNVVYKLQSVKESGNTLVSKGTLTVAGVTKPIGMTVTANRQANGNVVFTGSAPMKMSDFGMEAPKFLGISTGDAITVKFEVVGSASPTAAN